MSTKTEKFPNHPQDRGFYIRGFFLSYNIYMTARSKKIIQTSIIGIISNLTLAGFKIFVGFLSNSIAIILDAINNLSDSLSSIVTIIGAHFAGKAPDRRHPMGHGRSEYLSTVIIAIFVLYIGLTALVESIKKIITPVHVDYQTTTIIVVSAAIVVKIFLGLFFRHRGKKLESGSLVASGIDALFDAAISLATLVAIVVFLTTKLQVEAYLAACISLFIIYSGVKMMRGAFSIILGERASTDLTRRIKADIAKIDGVNGAFDLIMHDYGAGATLASVNIEVDHALSASDIDGISRNIQKTIRKKYHIIISSVGIYAIDLKDPTTEKLWRTCRDISNEYEHIIEIHGFSVDTKDKTISFDIVVDFAASNRRTYYQKFVSEIRAALPDYSVNVTLDSDISD